MQQPSLWTCQCKINRANVHRSLHHHLSCFVFFIFLLPPECLSPSPTAPEAVLLESELCGTSFSIMRNAHQAHVESDSLSTAGTVQKDNTSPSSHLLFLCSAA